MAQIGYGYGSEFQLLRFLGHHRNVLEEAIRKVIGDSDGSFYWLILISLLMKWLLCGLIEM
mgnify:CR=1 FL=1